MKRVVVISAHPDDVEIGCSGTLQKFSLEGAKVTSVITIAPSVEVKSGRDCNIVSKELSDSYLLSGWRLQIHNTNLHKNRRPNLLVDNNTMTELADLIDEYDIAIIPNPQDYHQDHRNTYQLALPLVRNCKEIWCQHQYPYNEFYTTAPNMLVDISDTWQFKKDLLGCYPSYIDQDYIDKVRRQNHAWGLQRNCKYAEAFTVVKRHA
jgi:LmbE family N-acetylglucosaminyl deacetylase